MVKLRSDMICEQDGQDADGYEFIPGYQEPIDPGLLGYLISLLNPHCVKFSVVLGRCLLVGSLYTLGLYTSLIPHKDLNQLVAIVGSAAAAAIILVAFLYYSLKKMKSNFFQQNEVDSRFWKPYDYFAPQNICELAYHGAKAILTQEKYDIRDAELLYKDLKDGIFDERVFQVDSGSYWFDFVADVGDGFDSTFAVASILSKRSLQVEERDEYGNTHQVSLPRGDSLVVGGDICYPVSNERHLKSRFFFPYSLAFDQMNPDNSKRLGTGSVGSPEESQPDVSPRMYITIGNHEWLDGLRGVRDHVFPRKKIGGWSLPQTNSYFAIRLPKGWWIFSVDIGPEPEDINLAQRKYFENIARTQMGQDDTVIIAIHVPTWIKSHDTLGFAGWLEFQELCGNLGDRLRMILSGDIHYYKRMELANEDLVLSIEEPDNSNNCFKTDKVQLITAGHGGAFGHLAHLIPVEHASFPICRHSPPKTYKAMTEYPSFEDSEKLMKDHLLKGVFTSGYSSFAAFMYFLMFLPTLPQGFEKGIAQGLLNQAFTSSFFYFSVLLFIIIIGFTLGANNSIETVRRAALAFFLFILHIGMHLMLAFGLRVAVDSLVVQAIFGQAPSSNIDLPTLWLYSFATNSLFLVLASLSCPFPTYFYYRIAYSLFKHHWSEIPVNLSLVNSSHKGFMRIGIQENGDLFIYAIVIDEVPTFSEANQANQALEGVRLLEKIELSKHANQI